MRNLLKKTKHTLLSATFLLLLFVPAIIGSAAPKPARIKVTCPRPDVTLTGQTGSSVSFAWDAVWGAESYTIRCVRKDNNAVTFYYTGNTSITIPVTSGTYCFYICTTCSGGNSEYVIIDEIYI